MSPDGTTTDAPGSAAARSDTHSSHPIGGRTNGATNTAIGGQISAHKAITAPNTVMIPITGATAMFAAIVTTLKVPAMAPTNGAVTTNAAPETAVISENQRGQPLRRSTSTHTGAMITSAPVAVVDSANPQSTASSGLTTTRTMTAAASAGSACLRRPVTRLSRPTKPITDARRTLGDGLATTTKATRATTAKAAPTRGLSAAALTNSRTAPSRMLMLAPDTAVRWESPATVKLSFTTGDSADVSPTTRPGSRPA